MKDSFAFSGSLEFMNLSEIFQLLGANASTGILSINNRYSETPGIIYFKSGNPIDASLGSLTGLDAVYALFGWAEGDFSFNKETVENKVEIKLNRMEIILEGTKMLDEGLIEKQGPVSFKKNSKDDSTLPVVRGPLVDYMYVADEEDYQDGETICRQGRHGNWIWVVLDGVLEMRKETPTGQVPILRVGTGSFIGNISSFLIKGNVRNYTVVAVGEVQLGVLDSQRLSRECAILSNQLKKIIMSLDKRSRQCANRTSEFLSKKNKADESLRGKTPLIKQGESREGFFLIEQGVAYIARKVETGLIQLARLEEDDFIGHIPFLSLGHEPHSASVFASDDLKMKQIDAEALEKEHNQQSTCMKNLIENTANAISAMTMVMSGTSPRKTNAEK